MTSAELETFLSLLREVPPTYHAAQAAEQEENDVTQDILHALELEDQIYHQCAYLARDLGRSRQRRRQAKDTRLRLEPIVAWLEANQPAVKSLERLLGDVRKAEKRLENRVYIPRTRRGQE